MNNLDLTPASDEWLAVVAQHCGTLAARFCSPTDEYYYSTLLYIDMLARIEFERKRADELAADRDNSNRLLDECRHERNVLQRLCAERADQLDAAEAKLKPIRIYGFVWKVDAGGLYHANYTPEQGQREGRVYALVERGDLPNSYVHWDGTDSPCENWKDTP